MPFTSNGTENCHDPPDSFHVAELVKEKVSDAINAGDMQMFLVACDTGVIARQLHHVVNCDA
jgi:hypothetical protein